MDHVFIREELTVGLHSSGQRADVGMIQGIFQLACYDAQGQLLWAEATENTIMNVGIAQMLDTTHQTSVAIVGSFVGLIGATGFSAIVATDTMASHAGWVECGTTDPAYTGNRPTATWAAAVAGTRSKAFSTPVSYTITGAGGTVQGAFIVYSTGAVNTKGSTAGTLWSAGAFGTPQPVVATNTLTVNYSTTIT